jgi:hypothetical protein
MTELPPVSQMPQAPSPDAPLPPPTPALPPLPRTSGLAIASLVLGTTSLAAFWCCCGQGFVPSVLGVIFGHVALAQIKRSQGRLDGRGLAIAGAVTGYLGIAIHILMLLLFLVAMACGHAHHQTHWRMHEWGD